MHKLKLAFSKWFQSAEDDEGDNDDRNGDDGDKADDDEDDNDDRNGDDDDKADDDGNDEW